MPALRVILSLLIVLVGYVIFKVVWPPLNFPRNIPTIPCYVVFLPIIFDIDQVDIYNTYIKVQMEKYGAVKIFFGSRWNILVSKPEYLAQIFKEEDVFAKSGNQKKIPYSAIAAYTGDNIISAHGDVWRKYRSIMTNGLQHFKEEPFICNAKKFCGLLRKNRGPTGNVLMGPLIQRLTLDNISQVVLGFNFGTLSEETNELHQHLIKIKKQIFHPFFLTFPFFDMLPIPSRKKAFQDISKFREVLVSRVKNDLINNYKFEQTSYVSSDLIKASL